MSRLLAILVVLAAPPLTSAPQQHAATPSKVPVAAMDLEVYRSVLNALERGLREPKDRVHLLVSGETLSNSEGDRGPELIEEWFKYYPQIPIPGREAQYATDAKRMLSIPRDARKSHVDRNGFRARIPSSFSRASWLVLENPLKSSDFMRPEKRFPGFQSFVAFSQPGYNETRTTAIVLVKESVFNGGGLAVWYVGQQKDNWTTNWQVDLRWWVSCSGTAK